MIVITGIAQANAALYLPMGSYFIMEIDYYKWSRI